MNVRMATCQELAQDRKANENIARYFIRIEQNSTPVSILLPWFPGAAKIAKEKATLDLYLLIRKYVRIRRKAVTLSTDPIDFLIANGDSDDTIIGVSVFDLYYHFLFHFDISTDRDGVHLFCRYQHWRNR
jgi:sterol 14-demethylase